VAVHEHKRYKFIDIPDSFQNNVNWRESIASLIDRFIYLSNSQHEMDTLYNEFCSVLVGEMDSFLKYSCASKKSTGGTGSRQYKPFWTNDLKRYWKDMKDAEKKFLYAKRNDSFYHDFTRKRKLFMKELRQTERKYWQSQLNELENISTNDPKAFWQYIKKLGPRKQTIIPEKVYVNNILSDDIATVLNKWQHDFYTLYKVQNDSTFNNEFYEKAKSEKLRIEYECTKL
jgi:hypothetical protein